MKMKWIALLLLSTVLCITACSEDKQPATPTVVDATPEGGQDIQVGLVDGSLAGKADGTWGAATTCKPIPEVEPLNDPMIVVSVDGLTVHLFDRQGDYDRVFRTGVGAKNSLGVSLTPTSDNQPEGVFWAHTDKPVSNDSADHSVWSWNMSCRMWWTNPDNGEKIPVFGGLPWIRLEGPRTLGYGLHGPIDNFTAPSGGSLRRGYVSHGCMRMAAEDIVEVWGRIQGHKVPVRIQQAPELDKDGAVLEVEEPWMLSPCQEDSDCGFDQGICNTNVYSGQGYCTRTCESTCPDKRGYPETFCVADPDKEDQGICTLKDVAWMGCRHDHFVSTEDVARFGDPSRQAKVCLPGTQGWIGDRCFSNDECDTDLCTPLEGGPVGLCTKKCDQYCPDKEGDFSSSFCVNAPASLPEEGGLCVARCVHQDDCAEGTVCAEHSRFGEDATLATACVPAQ